MKMPAETKAKWLEALRSGEYKQGTQALKTEDGNYCCLGVLEMVCEGQVERTLGTSGHPDGRIAVMPTSAFYTRNNINASLETFSPGVLSEMNDVGKLSFADIADYIEQNVEAF